MMKTSMSEVVAAYEHAGDEHKRERHHDHQAVVGFTQLAIFAGPLQMHTLGQLDLARDRLLGVFDCPLQIASAHGETQRHVTLQTFAVDE